MQLPIDIAESKTRPFLHLDNVFRPGASVAIAAKVLVQLAMESEQRYAANG